MENQNKVHWKSTLMAINPERIERCRGTIVRTVYNESLPGVFVVVRRDKDSLEGTIDFTHYPAECYEGCKPKDPNETPKSIRDLYQDFQVSDSSELVNRGVVGFYFFDSLVAIQKED